MKKEILLASSLLGITTISFGQTTEEIKSGQITSKETISSTESVYYIKDDVTGFDYRSLPTQAQLAIGEHIGFLPMNENLDMNMNLERGNGVKGKGFDGTGKIEPGRAIIKN